MSTHRQNERFVIVCLLIFLVVCCATAAWKIEADRQVKTECVKRHSVDRCIELVHWR